MASQLTLDYDKVYEQTAAMKAQLDAALKDMDSKYRQLGPLIEQTDGAANAALKEAAAANQKKSRTSAETLKKLLSFIETSAKSTKEVDEAIERIFGASAPQPTGRW